MLQSLWVEILSDKVARMMFRGGKTKEVSKYFGIGL